MDLFTQPLSKLSIGAYMELCSVCREVGKSFEASIGALEGGVQV